MCGFFLLMNGKPKQIYCTLPQKNVKLSLEYFNYNTTFQRCDLYMY